MKEERGTDTQLSERRCVNVLGVEIDPLNLENSLKRIEELIASGGIHQHVVVNAAKIVEIQKNAKLSKIIDSCSLVNVDGQPVVWASWLLGNPLPERVAGVDLMIALLALSEKKGYRVYFFGAREEVVNEVVERSRDLFPNLRIGGWHSGYFDEDEERIIIEEIRASKSDILFVAMGTPQKEYWLAKHKDVLNVPFCMGVGGSFDVFTGRVRRAPQWMQRSGLEWFYRFLQEPKRMWKRYLVTNSLFIWLVIKAYFRHLVARFALRPRH